MFFFVECFAVEKEAVLGANVVLQPQQKLIDVTGDKPVERKGLVNRPDRCLFLVLYQKNFQPENFKYPCGLIYW